MTPVKLIKAPKEPDELAINAPPIGQPTNTLDKRLVSAAVQEDDSTMTYPKEHTAIMSPIFIPIIFMSSVICATHADCNEINPPEKNP